MKNKSILAAMATLALISCNSKEASKYARDTFEANDGTEITFTYYGHASIGIEALGKHGDDLKPLSSTSADGSPRRGHRVR